MPPTCTSPSLLTSKQFGFPDRKVRYCSETGFVDILDTILTYTTNEGAATTAMSRILQKETDTEHVKKITWEGDSKSRKAMHAKQLSEVLCKNRGIVARRTAKIVLQITENAGNNQVQLLEATPVEPTEAVLADEALPPMQPPAATGVPHPVPVYTNSVGKQPPNSAMTLLAPPFHPAAQTVAVPRMFAPPPEAVVQQQLQWRRAMQGNHLTLHDPDLSFKRKREEEEAEFEMEERRKNADAERARLEKDADAKREVMVEKERKNILRETITSDYELLVSLGRQDKADQLLERLVA